MSPTQNAYVLNKYRWVPTTPWEGVWHAVGEWLGVSTAGLQSRVLPNFANFVVGDTLFTAAQLFA